MQGKFRGSVRSGDLSVILDSTRPLGERITFQGGVARNKQITIVLASSPLTGS